MDKITPDQAGCWLDGSMGWHNTYRVIETAFDYGWLNDDQEDKEQLEAAIVQFKSTSGDSESFEIVHDASDEATDYLRTLAPDGYEFEWDAGELILHKSDDTDDYPSNTCSVCGGPQLGAHYHETDEEE